jgi:cytochrome P450
MVASHDAEALARNPVVDFDLFASTTRAASDEAWREVRAQCPIAWSDRNGGFWVVSGYEAVAAAFRDWEHFSSARTNPEICAITLGGNRLPLLTPEEIDPPDWYPLRRVLSELLAPRAAERLRPRVQHWTTHFIDEIIESGHCEFTHDISVPVPGSVTLEWMGFPSSDWKTIAESFHDVAAYSPGTVEFRNATLAFGSVTTRITEEIEARYRDPRDDAMTAIAFHEIDGARIPRTVAESIVFMTVAGGVDTTTALIGAALLHLSQFPDDRRRLVEEPELLGTATEEFLRYYPPARSHARTVMKDVDFAGCHMRKSDRVLLSEIASGRDGEVFADPERFVIDRTPNRHLSFGVGIHRCVGSHLARIEFVEVIQAILTRMPDFQIDEDGVTEYPNWATIGGWATLPARFTPGKRSGREAVDRPFSRSSDRRRPRGRRL